MAILMRDTPASREEIRKAVADSVATFLEGGGRISKIKNGVSGEYAQGALSVWDARAGRLKRRTNEHFEKDEA